MNESPLQKDVFILLIDDSATQREMICEILIEKGYIVYTAHNGESGLVEVESRSYDLILLDVVMPDISGFEMIKIIKRLKINMQTPIIFISGMTDNKHIVDGLNLGANDYVLKPFSKEVLLARIETQLKLNAAVNNLQNEINEKEQLISKIELQNHELSELNTMKNKILSILVHDIKSQIHTINGFSTLLLDTSKKYDTIKVHEFLTLIHSSTVSINEFIDNILSWAKKNWNKEQYNPELLELKDVVDECIFYYQNVGNIKGVSIKSSIEKGTKVFIDQEMLNTVLRNLISNGLKFTPKDGTIQLSTTNADSHDYLNLIIEDTGVGIPKHKIPDIFNPTNQRKNTIGTNGEKGTGLGLLICNEYIKKNGGTISVESEVGEGTRFIISLPIRQLE